MTNISLSAVDGGYALQSPYYPMIVDAIKSLPYADRRWDPGRKVWIIAPHQAQHVVEIVQSVLGLTLTIPAPLAAGPTLRAVRMDYLGRCKARDGGSFASGYSESSWSLVFPESVLRSWFSDGGPDQPPTAMRTLYQVLTVKPESTVDDIKTAYRQLARQWHPDVCKEPDASEQFQRIQHAWEVLRNDKTRRKYNAGLALEASQHRLKNHAIHRHDTDAFGYRAPLRNGYLLLEGSYRVGQLVVSKILKWDDVVDNRGRTMVSSWPAGADTFRIDWI